MFKTEIDEYEMDDIPQWPAEESLSGYLLETGKTLMLNKNEIMDLINKGIINLVGTISEQWLGVPIKVSGKVIGVMALQSYKNPQMYDYATLEFL